MLPGMYISSRNTHISPKSWHCWQKSRSFSVYCWCSRLSSYVPRPTWSVAGAYDFAWKIMWYWCLEVDPGSYCSCDSTLQVIMCFKSWMKDMLKCVDIEIAGHLLRSLKLQFQVINEWYAKMCCYRNCGLPVEVLRDCTFMLESVGQPLSYLFMVLLVCLLIGFPCHNKLVSCRWWRYHLIILVLRLVLFIAGNYCLGVL